MLLKEQTMCGSDGGNWGAEETYWEQRAETRIKAAEEASGRTVTPRRRYEQQAQVREVGTGVSGGWRREWRAQV